MKSLIIVFGALLLIIALPLVFISIDESVTQHFTQSISGVATAAGEYAANVTLGRAVYKNDTISVVGISSNITNDTPTASAYNSVSRALEVSGLDQSAARTLSIEFLVDSTTLPAGAELFLSSLLRWFFVFAIIGMVAGAIYAFFD